MAHIRRQFPSKEVHGVLNKTSVVPKQIEVALMGLARHRWPQWSRLCEKYIKIPTWPYTNMADAYYIVLDIRWVDIVDERLGDHVEDNSYSSVARIATHRGYIPGKANRDHGLRCVAVYRGQLYQCRSHCEVRDEVQTISSLLMK